MDVNKKFSRFEMSQEDLSSSPEIDLVGVDIDDEQRRARNIHHLNGNIDKYWRRAGALNKREKTRQAILERNMEKEHRENGMRLNRYTETLKKDIQELEAQKRAMRQHPVAGYSYHDNDRLHQRNMLDRYGTRGRYLFSIKQEMRYQRHLGDSQQTQKPHFATHRDYNKFELRERDARIKFRLLADVSRREQVEALMHRTKMVLLPARNLPRLGRKPTVRIPLSTQTTTDRSIAAAQRRGPNKTHLPPL